MEQTAGFVRVEPVPDPLWHDERVPGVEANARLRAHRRVISIVEAQVDCATEHAQELVAVGVHLTAAL